MKQTAVEWLRKEIETIPNYSTFYTNNYQWIDSIMNEAKAMEKEQIINAQEDGFTDGCRYTTGFEQTIWYDGEQYYNETYKNKKQ